MTLPNLCLRDGCMRLAGHEGGCDKYTREPLKNLPKEILKKIDKTAMTRGAQPYERVPYQNRVRRWNRAVVPFKFRKSIPPGGFENGHVIMVRPEDYFDSTTKQEKDDFPDEVVIGKEAFIYYDNRRDWLNYPPAKYGWTPCEFVDTSGKPLGKRKGQGADSGHFLARVPGTTTAGSQGQQVVHGMPQGIRFFEYVSQAESWRTQMQLGYLAWKTVDIEKHSSGEIAPHMKSILSHHKLDDDAKLTELKVLKDGKTCCPLCREYINAEQLIEKVEQAEGREVVDLTITEANLFHLEALRPGQFKHGAYKVGWGHHHCNAAARDMGIEETLDWMEKILTNAGRMMRPT
jgi:hypothetical protein